MDKSNLPPGPKVSQIAHIFQRKTFEDEKVTKDNAGGNAVMRTESHAARFNNARALFEKLGEAKINRPSAFSIKHSTSKDDNLKDPSPDRERPRSPSPKKKYVGISNGVGKNDLGMIQNVSRIKAEKPEKPEKPERKFNSKELIEKQKNWTSHFSKSRSSPSAGINRCDIIRTVPGTAVINNAEIHKLQETPPKATKTPSVESPPSPSIRQSQQPPEIKPRTTSRSNSLTSPTKSLPSIPPPSKPSPEHVRSQRQPDGKSSEPIEKPPRRSFDFNEPITHSNSNHSSLPPETPNSRRYSSDKESNSLTSPAHAINSAASSSGASSPVHTEDEKQENESNEKTDNAIADDADSEGKQTFTYNLRVQQ